MTGFILGRFGQTLTVLLVMSFVIYALIGKVADALVRTLERRLLPWKVSA